MKNVYIQGNHFLAEQIATSQEDNHFGIKDKWDLYNPDTKKEAGFLVQYNKTNMYGEYTVIHNNNIRYSFDGGRDVYFTEL